MAINHDECPKYLNDFFFYCQVVKGRSARTVEAYYFDLRLFLRYLKAVHQNISLESDITLLKFDDVPIEWLRDFTLNDAYQYLYYVSDERSNNAKTRARKASALKVFFKYLCVKANLIPSNPLEHLEMPSVKKSLPKYLTLEESISMLRNVSGDDFERDYCIVTLFLNCGMRLSELVGLNIRDINFNENSMRLLGKGNKERIIFLNGSCIAAIEAYLKVRKPSESEPNALFLSKRGSRICKRRVEQIVENTVKAAGINKSGISAHKLRHTAATMMYQNGVDTLVLKEILGHASISTTEIYTHISNKNVKEASEKTPLAKTAVPKKE